MNNKKASTNNPLANSRFDSFDTVNAFWELLRTEFAPWAIKAKSSVIIQTEISRSYLRH